MMMNALKQRCLALRPRARLALALVGALSVYLGAIALIVPVFDRVALNGTPSVAARVLWKTPGAPIGRGDFVLAPASHPMIPPDYRFLTKHALCLEGDMLTVRDGAFFCNGGLLHRTKRRTRDGAPLQPFQWAGGVIPEGMMFIGSRHPDGFDSRYLGLVATRDLVRLKKVL
jgi:conjugal transfer pilin signal peptidase TrbI